MNSTSPRTRTTTRPGGATSARRLTRRECWSRLRRHGQGRLGYLSGRGPRQVVLPYAVWDGRLVVRVPAYHEAAQHAAGRTVTFDVVEQVAPGTTERIEVQGHALLGEPQGPVLEVLPDEKWPEDLPSRLVWLQVHDLRGQTEPARQLSHAAPP